MSTAKTTTARKKTTTKAKKAEETAEVKAAETAAVQAAEPDATQERRRAKVTRLMNVRAQPAMGDTKIVAVIKKGTEITVLADVDKDWVKIESKDTDNGCAFVWTNGGKNIMYF